MRRAKPHAHLKAFIKDIQTHTPFINLVILMVVLWLLFSAGIYFTERGSAASSISAYGDALYWGVAAFSTAGIADTPTTAYGKLIGAIWIVIGSMLFFGTIVATVTTYFMRPMQRPHKKIIDTIEYNLEQLDELSVEELDLLKGTVDTLIIHMEKLKKRQAAKNTAEQDGAK